MILNGVVFCEFVAIAKKKHVFIAHAVMLIDFGLHAICWEISTNPKKEKQTPQSFSQSMARRTLLRDGCVEMDAPSIGLEAARQWLSHVALTEFVAIAKRTFHEV